MSTDRELLELAAKAAGIRIEPVVMRNVRELGDEDFIGYRANPDQCQRGWFNPLTDDGDALRLAAALHIDMQHDPEVCEVSTQYVLGREGLFVNEEYAEGGCLTALRRAIVRAAAEIGRAMP